MDGLFCFWCIEQLIGPPSVLIVKSNQKFIYFRHLLETIFFVMIISMNRVVDLGSLIQIFQNIFSKKQNNMCRIAFTFI